MNLDINAYRINKPALQLFIEKWVGRNKYALCSEFSCYSAVPVIAVFVYYGELYGFDDELKNRIENAKKFYGINSIIGYKEV